MLTDEGPYAVTLCLAESFGCRLKPSYYDQTIDIFIRGRASWLLPSRVEPESLDVDQPDRSLQSDPCPPDQKRLKIGGNKERDEGREHASSSTDGPNVRIGAPPGHRVEIARESAPNSTHDLLIWFRPNRMSRDEM